MTHWLLLAAGVALLALSFRLRERTPRTAAQGLAVLLAASGVILVFQRPGSALHLPGHGPRRWTQP
jgi:membrane-associated PAP2 superfamily phosphatase